MRPWRLCFNAIQMTFCGCLIGKPSVYGGYGRFESGYIVPGHATSKTNGTIHFCNELTDFNRIPYKQLHGDGTYCAGDFRNAECIELLKQADIVVTNPPFSLFREYVAQLIAYDKKFLIIGNQNAITYEEIFPLIKGNKLWLGYTNPKEFVVPQIINKNCIENSNGVIIAKFGNIVWFTNLEHSKRNEELPLYKLYNPEEYPKYDNYDAINVDKVNEIPCDYDGVMGVPITFLDKYNPEQFEILGMDDHRVEWRGKGPSINGKVLYRRIIIRRRTH